VIFDPHDGASASVEKESSVYVAFQIGRYTLNVSLAGALTVFILLCTLISLGFWQLRRADEKRQLVAAFASGQQATIELTGATTLQPGRYQHIHARGQYDVVRQLLLDNLPSSEGAPGYHVLTPFIVASSGAVLLVDRGWVSMGANRKTLPNVEADAQLREISGRIDELPRPGVRMGAAGEESVGWPKVFNYPRYEDLRALYGERLMREIVLLDPQEPSGYERIWQARFGLTPERHMGYAITWFVMALTLVIIYGKSALERNTANS
jgi:surfeit locus 1 family protein